MERRFGRMALTGTGAALFSQGRSGGIGAGLLDLSLRGADKQIELGGILVWPDTTNLQFVVKGKEIDQLLSKIHPVAFEADAVERAAAQLQLVQRVKRDGLRGLREFAMRVINLHHEAAVLTAQAEEGETFQIRDEARRNADEATSSLGEARVLLRGMLYEFGMSEEQLRSTLGDELVIENIRLISGLLPVSWTPGLGVS